MKNIFFYTLLVCLREDKEKAINLINNGMNPKDLLSLVLLTQPPTVMSLSSNLLKFFDSDDTWHTDYIMDIYEAVTIVNATLVLED